MLEFQVLVRQVSEDSVRFYFGKRLSKSGPFVLNKEKVLTSEVYGLSREARTLVFALYHMPDIKEVEVKTYWITLTFVNRINDLKKVIALSRGRLAEKTKLNVVCHLLTEKPNRIPQMLQECLSTPFGDFMANCDQDGISYVLEKVKGWPQKQGKAVVDIYKIDGILEVSVVGKNLFLTVAPGFDSADIAREALKKFAVKSTKVKEK